jgi:superfamily I DNA/RNA helicase
MRLLSDVKPTAEQLKVLGDYQPGFALIRGAAGSGKTTTAVLRLRLVSGVWARERERKRNRSEVRALVLTYNRTLKGYVEALVQQQMGESVAVEVSTFAKWARDSLGVSTMIPDRRRHAKVWSLGSKLGFRRDFLLEEVEYVLERYAPEGLNDYANPESSTFERRGRGISPRVDREDRARILDEVIRPYIAWKGEQEGVDWSDLAVQMTKAVPAQRFDIVLVDEAQDFSANQLRAIREHLGAPFSVTLVMDAVQRIYPRGFTWKEAGIELSATFQLRSNHRNTRQIAAFALPLVAGLPAEDDGTLPDFESSEVEGEVPVVVTGCFRDQMNWALARIAALPEDESVALLNPKGGKWLDYARGRLRAAGVAFAEITRKSEWPKGPEQVALSTLHSAKGLEFDHVILLGLNAELLPHGDEESDGQLANHRRLVAMAIGRARRTVALTYKEDDRSRVIEFLDPDTFVRVLV